MITASEVASIAKPRKRAERKNYRTYPPSVVSLALALYDLGIGPAVIARLLGVHARPVYDWTSNGSARQSVPMNVEARDAIVATIEKYK